MLQIAYTLMCIKIIITQIQQYNMWILVTLKKIVNYIFVLPKKQKCKIFHFIKESFSNHKTVPKQMFILNKQLNLKKNSCIF